MRLTPCLLLLPLALLCAPPARADAKDDLARRITGLHTRIYSQENLLLKPFEKAPLDDVADWRKVMADASAFIRENGGREDLRVSVAALNDASEALIRERTRSWDVHIRKCIDLPNPDVGISRIDKEKIRFARLDLSDVVEGNTRLQAVNRKLTTAQAALQRPRNPGANLKAALEINDRLALTLQLTIQKFEKDLIALKKAKNS